ncbi:MAG TPA: 3-dehydroquinate synthase, partial [Bacteroidota bacterium]
MPRSDTISVKLKPDRNRSYSITISSGLLAKIPILLQKEFGDARVFIITDETVREEYGQKLLQEFHAAGQECALLDFPPGEKSKQQSVVDALYGQLLELGIHRNSLIIGLGGGVVGDVA